MDDFVAISKTKNSLNFGRLSPAYHLDINRVIDIAEKFNKDEALNNKNRVLIDQFISKAKQAK